MNGPNSLPDTLRVVAANLNSAAHELARVLNSVASALEPATTESADPRRPRTAGTAPESPATPVKRAPSAKPAKRASSAKPAKTASSAKQASTTSSPNSVTDQTLRATMLELGPATSAQIAAHINTAAGRRVVDGRAIRGQARRLGARLVMRRGERLYRL